MKKIQIFLFAISVVFALASCGKNSIEYTTLAKQAALCGEKTTEMDIYIQETYVTGVSDSYVLIQDKTGAAQITLTKPNTELKYGSIISAHLKGTSKVIGGGLEFTDVEITGISSSKAAELPFEEVTIAELNTNPTSYTHRRILVKDITFAEHFNGAIGDKARIVQKGKIGTVVARTAEYYAIAGNQGDLFVYPSDGVYYVFTDFEFEEHEVISPFTQKSVYGIYAVGTTGAAEKTIYAAGVDQLSYGKSAEGRFYRIQSYSNTRVIKVVLPMVKLAQGNFVNASVSYVGLSGYSDVKGQEMYIEKLTSDKMWLMDFNTGLGYILPYEK